ncbi:hypothetical protein SeMB42_g07483 [Synchytrium endobioticum]|uniref:UDP-galactose transporter homolog 1 n=1 Tax=Synchytrium endobioticum TaxID=286115 RepID=A0A507CHL4_9FUNG|nr:hypothetical protein SeMB42_g07483 [Synchytrium endobioticum]TPX38789.1 hypothetical protein SeLEV6574_g07624 [Synchytrium endobioticum]
MPYGEFAACVIGIYICFIKWGELQERITTIPYPISSHESTSTTMKFKYYLFLNLSQSIIACVASFVYLIVAGVGFRIPGLSNIKKDDNSSMSARTMLLLEYLQVSLMLVIAPQFGYASLKHIDYPTMILGKSCKLVPVMLANIVLHRRSFATYKYVVVGLITAGVSAFMLLHDEGDSHSSSKAKVESSLYGLGLLLANLLIDGATNSAQETMFKKYHMKGPQMMFFMNIGLSFIMSAYLLLNPYSSELSSAISMISKNPDVSYDILIFGICGSLGQLFIFHTLQRFGSVSLVTITVTRKMLTILWSVFRFGHHLNAGQWLAVGLVFVGIFIDAYAPMLKSGTSTVILTEKVEAKGDILALNGHTEGSRNGNGHIMENGEAGTSAPNTPRRISERLRKQRRGVN